MPRLPDQFPDSPPALIIRATTVADVPAMDILLQGLADFLGQPEAYCRDSNALAQFGFGEDKVFESIIAYSGSQPAGLCVYFPEFSTWRGQPGVYVQDLYVTPALRGSGLGKRLVAHTLDHAVDAWQAGYIRLSADRQNQSAIHFYQRLGFAIDQDNLILKMGTGDLDRTGVTRIGVAAP